MRAARTARRSVGLLLVAVLAVVGASGCAKKKEKRDLLASAAPEQVYRRSLELLGRRELRQAIELLERIEYEPGSEMRETLEPLVRLALADATFYQNTGLAWIEAHGLYEQFIALRGNHPLAPYAQTQIGLCTLKQVSHASRDQLQTEKALSELKTVISRYPDSYFSRAAATLYQLGRSNLAESEFLVGKFYLKRKAYQAAADRFRVLLETFPEYAERIKVEYHLGRALVLSEAGTEGRLILDRLIARHPDSAYAKPARKLLARHRSD